MPISAYPHQLDGAAFLAERRTALLADEPRVGKTGAAIMAADQVLAAKIVVVTTASGRAVWQQAFDVWSGFPRDVKVFPKIGDVTVVSWGAAGKVALDGLDLLILDESHYAKNPTAKRTAAVYGAGGLARRAKRVWCLTGTPIPNAPNDLWSMLYALAPELIDGMEYEAFLEHYCITRKRYLSRYKSVDVVVGGRNLDDLRDRLKPFMLRRTQADVGITQPIHEVLPLLISAAEQKRIVEEIEEADDIFAAIETGETESLGYHLGTLRRITASIKARGVAELVAEEFACGLDRVVLMCWHKDTMTYLADALSRFGVVRVDGGTSADARGRAVRDFTDGAARVFIGQILACGEAIDLSAANELIFVEMSFVPKDGQQAALRITNHNQRRQPRVRVAALHGSVDEAVMRVLTRKLATNRKVMTNAD